MEHDDVDSGGGKVDVCKAGCKHILSYIISSYKIVTAYNLLYTTHLVNGCK